MPNLQSKRHFLLNAPQKDISTLAISKSLSAAFVPPALLILMMSK